MSESLPEFHLGIVGGCSSHQHRIPLNALYQRQLAGMLEADPGIRLRPYIVRDFELDLRTRLDRLLAGPPMDGVLVHIRAANMVVPGRLVRHLTTVGANPHSVLNPALLSREHPSSAALSLQPRSGRGRDKLRGPDAYGDSPDSQDRPPRGPRIFGFRVRNLNLALGALVGLDNWAIAEELRRFDEFEKACRECGLPLFAVGPLPVEYSYWTRRIVRKANALIRRHLSGGEVPFALIDQAHDAAGRPLTRADGVHLTVEGQRFLAEVLYDHGMREWMTSILKRS
jgi:hypothetical protein